MCEKLRDFQKILKRNSIPVGACCTAQKRMEKLLNRGFPNSFQPFLQHEAERWPYGKLLSRG